jgi:hypothetical protein
MSARLVPEACIALQLPQRGYGTADIAAHPELSAALRAMLAALVAAA